MLRALFHIAAPCRALLPLAPTRLLGRAPGHARPGARPGLACHNTTHCIATKTGKWAVAHPSFLCMFFFFIHFFFICSTHCKTTKKILLLFFSYLPVEPQKKKFSSFTYCKTNRKKKISSIYIYFFFIPSKPPCYF